MNPWQGTPSPAPLPGVTPMDPRRYGAELVGEIARDGGLLWAVTSKLRRKNGDLVAALGELEKSTDFGRGNGPIGIDERQVFGGNASLPTLPDGSAFAVILLEYKRFEDPAVTILARDDCFQ